MALKSFLIIGMGSFGTHLCKALAKRKCDIMIADSDENCVEKMLPTAVMNRFFVPSTFRPSTCALCAWVTISRTVFRLPIC